MKSFCIYLLIAFFLIPTSSCLLTKKINIVNKANDKYYNLAKYGLKSFSCKIEVKEINEIFDMLKENLANDHPIASAKNVQFLATMKSGGNIDLEILPYFDLKVEKFNKALKRMLAGAEDIISGTLGMWGGVTFDHLFPESESNYKVSTHTNHYYIEDNNNTKSIVAKLKKNLQLIEIVSYENTANTLKVHTDFMRMEKGYLLHNFSMCLNKGTYENDVEINYFEIEGFLLPKSFSISYLLEGRRQNITLLFLDYDLEKVP